MIPFSFIFSFLFIAAPEPKLGRFEPIHERELAVDITLDLQKGHSSAKIQQCLPSSSSNFPESLSRSTKEKIFTEKEFEDLKKCKVDSCAFRFRPDERASIHSAKSDDEIKNLFFKFYTDRKNNRVLPYSSEGEFRISASKEGFEFCQSKEFDTLLRDREHPSAKDLFQVDRADKRMRPTTRLNRGLYFKDAKSGQCFVEVLVFSNHYDLDRVLVWKVDEKSLRFQIRQRIDFLNSWWRRLRKNELQKALEAWAKEETLNVANCLSAQK